MTNTTNNDSGLNLDHLEALARATKSGRPSADVNLMLALDAETTLELIALARRDAPVSAPIAGDALPKPWREQFKARYPNYPQVELPWETKLNWAEKEIADLRAALANQPAPTAAPEQVAQTAQSYTKKQAVEAWACVRKHNHSIPDDALDGMRDVLYAALSQPSEAAPLDHLCIGFANNEQGVHVSIMQQHADGCFTVLHAAKVPTGDSFARVPLAAPSLPAAAPAPTVPVASEELFQRFVDWGERYGLGDRKAVAWDAFQAGAAHQPAQEQAEPVDASKGVYWFGILGKCARLLDLPDDEPIPSGVLAAVEKLVAASPVVCAQSEESASPPMLSPLDYRAQGREEALAIILAESSEDPFEQYIGWSKSGAAEDEGGSHWKEDALRELLHIGDSTHDAYDRAEAAYWQALGERDEAKREMLLVEQAPFYKPLHDFLSKHEAWDLMDNLKRPAAGAQQAHAGADEDGERWRFMMCVADEPDGREAMALEQLGHIEADDRAASIQMVEAVDQARAAIRAAQEGGAAC